MGETKSSSHKIFKDEAKNRIDHLQEMFTDIQLARKESRTIEIALLEDRMHDMLRDWRAELNQPSPASSNNDCSLLSLILQHCEEKDDATSKLVLPQPDDGAGDIGILNEDFSTGSLSSELRRLCQQYEENDDATSALAQTSSQKLDSESNIQSNQAGESDVFYENYYVNNALQEHGSQEVAHYIDSSPDKQYLSSNTLESANHLGCPQLDFHQGFSDNVFLEFNSTGQGEEEFIHQYSDLQPSVRHPPATAFLGPQCALWDCSRPAQGSDLVPDHCSSFHAKLAWDEGSPGISPILRPGGIGLLDGPLFSALSMKMRGKNVGIPECEGTATKKSPWNAPELFDISFLEGERIREWLFFDKPQNAFGKGERKNRSLPDHKGRGWHQSGKVMMKEHGGVKKSYYMDPQPFDHLDWHLYEYVIDNPDALTLYRLELKLQNEKKNRKGKISKDSLADLQKQMGRLNAESAADSEHYVRHGIVASFQNSDGIFYAAPNQMALPNEGFSCGGNTSYQ